jgi:hypothetical protein
LAWPLNNNETKISFSPLLHLNQGGLAVKEHLINYVASLFNVPEWGLNGDRLVNVFLVFFALVTIAVFQIVIYEQEKASKKSKKNLLQARLERVVLLGASLGKFLE